MIELSLSALGIGFAIGLLVGVFFVISGGLYVTESGLIDVRWPWWPRRTRRLQGKKS